MSLHNDKKRPDLKIYKEEESSAGLSEDITIEIEGEEEDRTFELSSGAGSISDRTSTAELSYVYSEANIKRLTGIETCVSEDWKRGDIILDLYEVKSLLGEGAFGKVYRVYHRGWNRELAVKTLHSHLISDEGHKKSFIKECQGWVNLGLHPNIVSCYYVRDLGGLPRIFLEYMDGGNLAEKIRGGKLKGWKEILDFSIQCLDGLSFAHGKGLIHRDIKPLNCLLTSGGVLKITDFGIASGLAKPGVKTDEGGNVPKEEEDGPAGTPAYMPPEQWSNHHGPSGPWSDIYSFGIMLYELSCGRRPFGTGGEPLMVLKAKHLAEEPKNPLEFNREIPLPLCDFILKCIAKKPEERFRYAHEARDELTGIYEKIAGTPYPRKKQEETEILSDGLNNRAVSMIDLGRIEEAETILSEALKREPSHPQAIYNRGLILWRSGRITDIEFLKYFEEVKNLRPGDPFCLYLPALIHLERGDLKEASRLLKEALRFSKSIGEIEGEIKKSLEQSEKGLEKNYGLCTKILRGHNNWVTSLSISPDGKYAVSGDQSALINLWNLSTGEIVKTFKGHTNFITSLAFSPDGKFFLSGSRDKTLRLWDISRQESLQTFEGHQDRVNCLSFTPDGKFAISGGSDKTLKFWFLDRGKCLKTFEGHSHSVEALCISPDGKYVLSGSRDKTLCLRDISSEKIIRSFTGHENHINSLCISPEGKFAFSAGGSDLGHKDNTIRIWDLERGECIKILKGHNSYINSISLSPDGNFILSGSEDSTIRLWDTATGQSIRTFETDGGVSSLAISSDGKFALSGKRKFTPFEEGSDLLYMWNLERRGSGPFVLVQPRSSAKAMEDAANYTALMEGAENFLHENAYEKALVNIDKARQIPGYEQSEKALDLRFRAGRKGIKTGLRTGWFVRSFEGHSGRISVTVVSPDGKFLLSGSEDKTLRLWNLSGGNCIRVFRGHTGRISSAAISPDGKFLISGSDDKTIRLWEIESGHCIRIFEGHSGGVTCLSLSQDGSALISGGWDKDLRLWNLETGESIRTFKGHEEPVFSLSISADSKFALSGSSDKTLRLWDLRKGKCLNLFNGHKDTVTDLSISMDVNYCLSGSKDETLLLWDLKKSECLKMLKGHKGTVYFTSLLPDRKFAFSGGEDSSLKLWNLENGEVIRSFEGHTGAVTSGYLFPEGRFAVSGSEDNTIRLWEFDWNYKFPEPADRDDGALPYLENFLHHRKTWNHEEFQELIRTLSCAGYGWLRQEGVKKELEKISSAFKRECPLTESASKPVVAKVLKGLDTLEDHPETVFNPVKEFVKNKTFRNISLLVSILLVLLAFIAGPQLLFKHRINTLINNLKSSDKEKQAQAIKDLVKIGKPAVEPLILSLKKPSAAIRENSAKALGETGDPRAVEPLAGLLEDTFPEVRDAAAGALAKIGEPSVEPLIEALGSSSSTVRACAAGALGEIKDVRAVEPLVRLLSDDSSEVNKKAIEALAGIGEPAVKSLTDSLKDPALRAGAGEALSKIGEPAVASLLREIGADNQEVRIAVVKLLGEIASVDSIEPLISALDDDSPEVREGAGDSLLKIGEAILAPLMLALKNPSVNIRENVVKILGKTDSPVAVEPLIEALRDEEPFVRSAAAEALGEIGDPSALDPLIELLKDKDPSVRQHALYALGETGDVRAVAHLFPLLEDKDPEVQRVAREVMEIMTDRLIALLGVEDAGVQKDSVKMLVKIGNTRAVGPVISLLGVKDPGVRKTAVEALEKMGDYRVAQPLMDIKEDDNKEVKRAVEKALKTITDRLILALKHEDKGIRKNSAEALGKIGDTRAVDPLLEALRDKDRGVRMSSTEALGLIGDPRAVKSLSLFLEGMTDEGKNAAVAISLIGGKEATEVLMGELGHENYEYGEWLMALIPGMNNPSVETLIAALDNVNTQCGSSFILGEMGEVRAVEPLIKLLASEKSGVRYRAVEALGKIGDKRAIEPLKKLINDSDEDVRQVAAEALKKLEKNQ